MHEHLCPTPNSQVAATIIDGQAVIVMATTGQVTVLNEVGSRIWELCDGTRPISEVIATITDEYETEPEQAYTDVNAFLERLIEIEAIVLLECR